MKSLEQLHAEAEAYEAQRLRRVRRSGSFTPETIVEKFFAGELCDNKGNNITILEISGMATFEIEMLLLECMKRYRKSS